MNRIIHKLRKCVNFSTGFFLVKCLLTFTKIRSNSKKVSVTKKKRHKWDMSLWQKEKHATCIECQCVKEVQAYVGVVYYKPWDMLNFVTNAPDCNNIKSKTVS